MKPRLASVAIVGTALVTAVLGIAAPASAGPPGDWTVVSGIGVSNIVEPGVYRTADGTLHVAITGTANSTDTIEVAHVSAAGNLTGRHAAVPGWSGTTADPDLVAGPAGGMRLVFGGHRTTVFGDPYNEGYLYYTSADGIGASWTLAPNTSPAVAGNTGYVSSGTGVTTLADGTLVTAYPFQQRDLLPGRQRPAAVLPHAGLLRLRHDPGHRRHRRGVRRVVLQRWSGRRPGHLRAPALPHGRTGAAAA